MATNKRRKLDRRAAAAASPPISNKGSSSDSESGGGGSVPATKEELQTLLELYTKDQLVELLIDAALSDSALLRMIRDAADGDVVHRKIFVHGLPWDATGDTLVAAFAPYGEIDDCNVVVDKATGKSKGYGFVHFKTRAAAADALKEPTKKINNRVAHCQLASVGPAQRKNPATRSAAHSQDSALAAAVAVQNMALFAQSNPAAAYNAALMAGQGSGLLPAPMGAFLGSPALAASQLFGGLGGATSLLGAYGAPQALPFQGLGLQPYQVSPIERSASRKGGNAGSGGST